MGTKLVDLIAELSAASARLGNWLHPRTASNLADDIFRAADGQLAEHRDVMDIYGLFKQLSA